MNKPIEIVPDPLENQDIFTFFHSSACHFV